MAPAETPSPTQTPLQAPGPQPSADLWFPRSESALCSSFEQGVKESAWLPSVLCVKECRQLRQSSRSEPPFLWMAGLRMALFREGPRAEALLKGYSDTGPVRPRSQAGTAQGKLFQGAGENVQCQVRKRALHSSGPDPWADGASWDPEVATIRAQLQARLQHRAEGCAQRNPPGQQWGPSPQTP